MINLFLKNYIFYNTTEKSVQSATIKNHLKIYKLLKVC